MPANFARIAAEAPKPVQPIQGPLWSQLAVYAVLTRIHVVGWAVTLRITFPLLPFIHTETLLLLLPIWGKRKYVTK